MISFAGLWKRSVSSHGTLVSPASRAKISNVRMRSNGGTGTPTTTNRRSGGIEKYAVVGMMLIAWAWIMVFFGMIFYHGYQYRTSKGGRGTGDLRKDEIMKEESNIVDTLRLKSTSFDPQLSPLIIFTCKRDNYLRETLTDVLKYIPDDCSMGCPVVVSQDGKSTEVGAVIEDFTAEFQQQKPNIPLIHIQHKSALRKGSNNSYQALAQHYGWALKQVFDGLHTTSLPQRTIILEEDIHIAPDFFSYFRSMAPLLDKDTSLLAVSAFNDNGIKGTVKDVTRVLRSDFFPGLGWMMTGRLWRTELKLRWPSGYWDDWLREPSQRHDRKILRPEVSRTFHFGVSGGTSNNQFGSTLSKVILNVVDVDWSKAEEATERVASETAFEDYYWKEIQLAKLVPTVEEASEAVRDGAVRLEYSSFRQFQQYARHFQLMDDEKAGIPRTAYKGVVETRPYGDHLLFLVPTNVSFKTDRETTA